MGGNISATRGQSNFFLPGYFRGKTSKKSGMGYSKETRIVQVKKEDDPVIMATYIALSTFLHMKFKITTMGYFLIKKWPGGKNGEELEPIYNTTLSFSSIIKTE